MAGHPWIVDDAVAPDKPIDSAVLSRLKNFSAMNKLKKMALRVQSFHSIAVIWLICNQNSCCEMSDYCLVSVVMLL